MKTAFVIFLILATAMCTSIAYGDYKYSQGKVEGYLSGFADNEIRIRRMCDNRYLPAIIDGWSYSCERLPIERLK